jgi:CRP/FNR family cyclic AMP-dependent transcriptional regulator
VSCSRPFQRRTPGATNASNQISQFEKYRRINRQAFDPLTTQRIDHAITEMEQRKAALMVTKFEKKDAMPETSPSFWPGLNDPHKFLAKIGVGRSTSDYAKDSEVFVQGADADSIFYLQEGRAQVTVTSEQGKETTVGILEAGQFFGDGCLSDQTHRITTTKALTDCRITAIEKAAMLKALEDQPWFSQFLIDHLSRRNRRVEGDLMDQLFSSCEQRLTRLLFDKLAIRQSLLESVLRDKLAMSDGDPESQ